MEITVEHDTRHRRFEARVNGELAGFADYRFRDGVLAFTHTEIDPAFQGKGVAGTLIGAALDEVRADGGRVLPLCSYVADYISRHPEYTDLVAYDQSRGGGA